MRKKRKKKGVPFDVVPVVCELHPGIFCDTAKGVFMDERGQELRGENGEKVRLPAGAKRRLLLVLLRDQRNSLGNMGYSEMDELIIAKFPKAEQDFPAKEAYDKAVERVKDDMRIIKKEIQKVHGNEDIIEYGEGRNAFRIKPAHLCDQIIGKNQKPLVL